MKLIHAVVLNTYHASVHAFFLNTYHPHDLLHVSLKNGIILNLNTLASSEVIISEIRALHFSYKY